MIVGVSHRLTGKRTRGSWCRRVVAARDVTVPPSSQLDLPTVLVGRSSCELGAEELDSSEDPQELYLNIIQLRLRLQRRR